VVTVWAVTEPSPATSEVLPQESSVTTARSSALSHCTPSMDMPMLKPRVTEFPEPSL
jgi:hypothetical protein